MEPHLSSNILSVFFRNRNKLLKGILFILLSNVLLIANPLVLRQGILALSLPAASVWPWAFALFFISIISAAFKYYMRLAFLSVGREEEKRLRSKIFARIQQQSMAFFNTHGIGELMSRITNDISSYRDVLGPGILYPIYFLTLVVPGFIALFYLSSTLALISLIPVAAIPLLNFAIRKSIYETSKTVQESIANLSNLTQEDYSGIKAIKSYNNEQNMFKRFLKRSVELSIANLRLDIFEGLFYPFLTLITRLVTLLLVLAFGILTYNEWRTLNSADFVSFMWIQSYIFAPILMLGWALPIYQQGRASYDRLRDLYEEPIAIISAASDLKIPADSDIEFNKLSFQYPGSSRFALRNIDLQIKPGTFVGITGPTGSGKTTLFKILERAYEIPRGMVKIGSNDIHDYPLEAFREAMISVEQLPFLFSKTIAENVRFGKQDASQAEIESVANLADLHETVLSFPEGYDTIVGERGITLSGGQKQRVAMARSFLLNRAILLLDDIFSNVDANTEKKILLSIMENFKGKTVIVVSHRTSVLEKMDRILYMKEGEIVEDGSPQELLNKKSYFSALSQLQKMQA